MCPAPGPPNVDVDIWFAALLSDPDDPNDWAFDIAPKVIISDPWTCTDQWFPAITVDPDGGLHVVFYDNRLTPAGDPRSDCACTATFDLFYTYSADGGATWTDAPVRVGSVSSYFPASGAFIGDYIGAVSGRSGGTIKVYAPFMRNDAMFIGYSQSMYLMIVEQ